VRAIVAVTTFLLLVSGGALLGVGWYMERAFADRILLVDEVPVTEVALVLGARIGPGGEPSRPLRARLDVAASLHAAGRVQKLLLSGDDGRAVSDEVGPMRSALIARGVPEGALLVDPAGTRTFESFRRARDVYGLDDVVVVTNPFHLPRALYLAEGLGLRAVGVAAPETPPPGLRQQLKREARESFARLRAVVDVQRARAADPR